MHREILLLSTVVVLVACGGQDGSSRSAAGTAVVKMVDREWQINGTCEMSGDDITFIAPGDPMLTVGVNTAGATTPGGTFSAVSEGISVIIGSPDVPALITDIRAQSFEVSGAFLVLDGTSVDGSISVDCD